MDDIHIVRVLFAHLIGVTDLIFHKSDIERVMKERKLVNRFLAKSEDVFETAIALMRFCHVKVTIDLQELRNRINLNEHKNIIRICGKSLSNHPLLVINVSEIYKFIINNGDKEFINNLIFCWFDEIDNGATQEICVLIYHGCDKFMDWAPGVFGAIEAMNKIYCNIVKVVYVLDDVLSHNCRENLFHLSILADTEIKIINSSVMKNYLRFDIGIYERVNRGLSADNDTVNIPEEGGAKTKERSRKKNKNKSNTDDVNNESASSQDKETNNKPAVSKDKETNNKSAVGKDKETNNKPAVSKDKETNNKSAVGKDKETNNKPAVSKDKETNNKSAVGKDKETNNKSTISKGKEMINETLEEILKKLSAIQVEVQKVSEELKKIS